MFSCLDCFRTLLNMTKAEALALHKFRQECLSSGETEWIPFVTQAESLVHAQMERFGRISRTSGDEADTRPEHQGEGSCIVSSSGQKGTRTKNASASAGSHGSLEGSSNGVANEDMQEHTVAMRITMGDMDGKGKGKDKDESGQSKGKDKKVAGASVAGSDPFRFFQSSDGQKAFLHPLDMRQLLDDAELGISLPERLDAKVCYMLQLLYCVVIKREETVPGFFGHACALPSPLSHDVRAALYIQEKIVSSAPMFSSPTYVAIVI